MVRILRDMDGVHSCPVCGCPAYYNEMEAGVYHCTNALGCGHIWCDKE